MRAIVVLLVLIAGSFVSSDVSGVSAPPARGPRVALGVDPNGSQRYITLSGRRGPVYPTADVRCDGDRRTIPLTRSRSVGETTVATYAVPPMISEGMLKAVECRLLLPGREITLARQQIRAAWSAGPKTPKH